MLRRPTIHDIARELNVSRSTIYKAINNRGSIRIATRDRIIRTLERYGYRTDTPAADDEEETLRIGFVAFSTPPIERFPTNYLDHIRMGVNQAIDEFAFGGLRLEVDFRAPEGDREEAQTDAVEQLRDAGEVAGYVVMPAGDPTLEPAIDGLVESGLPVITVNRDLPTSQRLCYVGCDYIQSGRLAAELLGKMSGSGRLLTLIGHEPDSMAVDISDRMVGFRSRIADYHHLSPSPPHKFQGREELLRYLEQEITRDGVSGIYDVTGNMHIIGDFLIQRGLSRSVAVVGFDLYPETVRYLTDGAISAVVFQDMARQSYIATKMLVECIRSGEPLRMSIVNTPLHVVMAENVEYYRDRI